MRRASLPRLLLTSAVYLLGLAAIGVPAASAAAQDRINTAIAFSPVAIPNSVHPKALLAADLGPAPAETPLEMSVRFNMSAAQEAALDQLLADQQNPSSPRYHQWLTAAQFGAQFGLSAADLAKVTAWLTSQGFKVTGVANGGLFVTFTGTIAQAQTAFSTSIHNLQLDGETHFANVTNVQVPGAFAGVVAAVTGLHNFRLKPHLHSSVVRPDFTSSVSGDHYVAPGDLYTIYNVNPLLNAASPINGAGETIAVVGQVDIYPADVVAFRSASGLNITNLPTTVHAGTDPGPPLCTSCTYEASQADLAESSIDVEYSGAMAPSASILFINGVDVYTNSMTYAIDSVVAPIISTSYGACEAGWGTTELLTLNGLFKQANAQGQTVLAAAGDEGAADCDSGPYAQEGLAVDFPASSPYVTGMGGTMFSGDAEATGSGTTWATTQYWNGTSGSDVISSARSYIPEAPWNDSSLGNFGGGGGGASGFFTKPTWQVGTAADSARDVPDLSLNGSDSHDPFLYCVNVAVAEGADSCTSGFRIANSNLNVAGGTSFDSQIFGGMLALIEQKISPTKGLGNINPTLYALGNSSFYVAGQTFLTNPAVVFNDVTTGNNAMPCTAGTPNCGNGGSEGFNAANGYDLASGWGSVNVSNLATDWTKVTPLGVGSLGVNTSTTQLTIPPNCPTAGAQCLTTVAAGASVTLNAVVTGSAGTPTGTVQFFANNVALGSPIALSGSNPVTYTWTTSCTNLGQNVIAASYSGDMNYQGSRGPALTAGGASQTSSGSFVTNPIEVQVTNNNCPDFSVTPGGTGVTVSSGNGSLTVAAGGTIPPVTITAAAINGFVGTVSFAATATSTSGYSPTLSLSPASVSINSSITSAATTLTLSGITASLHLPGAPGQVDSGAMFARQTPAPSPHAGRTWYAAAGSGATIAALLLWMLPRRRRLSGLLLVALAVALIGGSTGCGSSQAGPPTTGNSNPYVGDYYVTVTGTYTSNTGQVLTHATVITYVIN